MFFFRGELTTPLPFPQSKTRLQEDPALKRNLANMLSSLEAPTSIVKGPVAMYRLLPL